MTRTELRERLLALLEDAIDTVMLGETIDHGVLNLIANVDSALAALDRLDGRDDR